MAQERRAGEDAATSPGEPERQAVRAQRSSFARSAGWTVLGTALPGVGLWPTRARALGVAVFALAVAGLGTLGWLAHSNLSRLASVVVQPRRLQLLAVAMAVVALAWVLVLVATHLLTRPRPATAAQRGAGALLVGVLAFVVSAPLLVGGAYARDQAALVDHVFRSSTTTRSQTRPTYADPGNPWASKARVNILLLGADSTAYRDQTDPSDGIRTDTVMMASVDTATGNTTLVQLPRNMEAFTFPAGSALAKAYPNGYWDGVDNENAEFELNSVYKNVPLAHPELFTGTDFAGGDAVKYAVEGITALKPDYFVMVSIDGLQKIVDAIGGVRVNVNGFIPVAQSTEQYEAGIAPAGGYIGPGQDRLLNGYYAMWFARSRSQSKDPDRMARQGCVVDAVVRQANPQTLLTHYEAIANAGKYALQTDIPQEMAPAMVELALRMKDARVRRVLFGYPTTTLPNGQKFKPWDPDEEQMALMVNQGIAATMGEASPAASATPVATASARATATATATATKSSAAPSPTAGATSAGTATGSATPSEAAASKATSDLTDACAWDPAAAAAARANPPKDLAVHGEH